MRAVRLLRNQRGLAMMAVLAVILVLSVLSALVLYLSGKEIGLTAVRTLGTQSFYAAEGGGYAARSALLALMNADPPGSTFVDPSLTAATILTWFAAGNANNQNPFAILDYLETDGLQFSINPTGATEWVVFHVDWTLATPRRKLVFVQAGPNPPPSNPLTVGAAPVNALGSANYRSGILLERRPVPHASCTPEPECFIHQLSGVLGEEAYQFFFSYTIVSDGAMPPQGRRRVTLTRDFSIIVRQPSFATYALFTDTHTTEGGGAVWFTSGTCFDGPAHTNGEFRFAFFPKFSDVVTSAGCNNAACSNPDRDFARFNNNGSPRRLQANENVVNGVRRDAPVVFDNNANPVCTNQADDRNNAPANFARGVPVIAMSPSSFCQKCISIGQDPANATPVTNLQIRQAIPELVPDDNSAVPAGIYIPVADSNANNVSDPGEPLLGGIFVQGALQSLTLGMASSGGLTNNLAEYTLVQSCGFACTQTVTVTVDRVAQTTMVTNTAWAAPQTRTFAGVPRGWQGSGSDPHATIIYVEGNIAGLSGTLEEKEQTTIATSAGRIDISGHLRYEDPPDPSDPTDNPLNILGLFTSTNDIRITTAAPNDLVIHGILMAGCPQCQPPDGVSSSVFVQNFNSGAPRGSVHLIGGLIEEFYGAFGTFSGATGAPQSGYGRDFRYDRRVQRGIVPPYFPTTEPLEVLEGDGLAGDRPNWRESTP